MIQKIGSWLDAVANRRRDGLRDRMCVDWPVCARETVQNVQTEKAQVPTSMPRASRQAASGGDCAQRDTVPQTGSSWRQMATHDGPSSLQGAFMDVVFQSLSGDSRDTAVVDGVEEAVVSSTVFRNAIAVALALDSASKLGAQAIAEIAIASVGAKSKKVSRAHFPRVLLSVAHQVKRPTSDIAARLVVRSERMPVCCSWMDANWYESPPVQAAVGEELNFLTKLHATCGVADDVRRLVPVIQELQDSGQLPLIPPGALQLVVGTASEGAESGACDLSAFTKVCTFVACFSVCQRSITDEAVIRRSLQKLCASIRASRFKSPPSALAAPSPSPPPAPRVPRVAIASPLVSPAPLPRASRVSQLRAAPPAPLMAASPTAPQGHPGATCAYDITPTSSLASSPSPPSTSSPESSSSMRAVRKTLDCCASSCLSDSCGSGGSGALGATRAAPPATAVDLERKAFRASRSPAIGPGRSPGSIAAKAIGLGVCISVSAAVGAVVLDLCGLLDGLPRTLAAFDVVV
jgi:hypothetical protein